MKFDWGNTCLRSWVGSWLNSLAKSLLWLLSRWLILLLLSLRLGRGVLLLLSLIIVQVTILRLLGLGIIVTLVWLLLLLFGSRVLLIPLLLGLRVVIGTIWRPIRLLLRLSAISTTIVVTIVWLFLLGTTNLVRDFLFLTFSILLLVGSGVTLILAAKNIELLIATRLIGHSYRCLNIRLPLPRLWLWLVLILPLILCGLLIWSDCWWILVAPSLSDRCTTPITRNRFVTPPNTEWTIASYMRY